jgi:hypothetical protein
MPDCSRVFERLPSQPTTYRARVWRICHGYAFIILADGLCVPAIQGVHLGQQCGALAQYFFGFVLRQAFVVFEVIGLDQFAL